VHVIKKIPVYPILLPLYAIVAFWVSNYKQVIPAAIFPLIAFCLIFALLVYAFWGGVWRDIQRAGFLAGATSLFFFSYGHLYYALLDRRIAGLLVGQHRVLLPAAVVVMALLVWGGWRWVHVQNFHQILNVSGYALILMVMLQLGGLFYLDDRPGAPRVDVPLLSDAAAQAAPQDLPDVYYFVLDGYGREDVLRNVYGYDVRPFYQKLSEMGFVIPECAQSNYAYTALSISSTLNMGYFEQIVPDPESNLDYRLHMPASLYDKLIKHNIVYRNFKKLGYRTITFDTGFPWLDIADTDVYVSDQMGAGVEDGSASVGSQTQMVRTTQEEFLRTTALLFFSQRSVLKTFTSKTEIEWVITLVNPGAASTSPQPAQSSKDNRLRDQEKYQRSLFVLRELEKQIDTPGPKFMYFHIVVPHYPYVFDPQGEFAPEENDTIGYVNQTAYITTRMTAVLQKILSRPGPKPIIILQSDHGWDWVGPSSWNRENRLKILSAYYLPGGAAQEVDARFSAVNIFRLIFSRYFAGDYAVLENRHYFSDANEPFEFEQVEDSCSDWNGNGRFDP